MESSSANLGHGDLQLAVPSKELQPLLLLPRSSSCLLDKTRLGSLNNRRTGQQVNRSTRQQLLHRIGTRPRPRLSCQAVRLSGHQKGLQPQGCSGLACCPAGPPGILAVRIVGRLSIRGLQYLSAQPPHAAVLPCYRLGTAQHLLYSPAPTQLTFSCGQRPVLGTTNK